MSLETKLSTISFALQFGGFYCSEHDAQIDNMIESYQYDQTEVDYQKTKENYAKKWLDLFEAHLKTECDLDIDLEYSSLWSPDYYNFETDEIITNIPEEQFKQLRVIYRNDEEFVDWVNEVSKSRDGFHSFYQGIEEVSGDDKILLNYIFRYLVNNTRDDLYLGDIEFEIELDE